MSSDHKKTPLGALKSALAALKGAPGTTLMSAEALGDDFTDKVPTTLDPCDDLLAYDDSGDGGDVTENTPTIMDPCPECGRELTRLVDWMPPPTPEGAWYGWVDSCVATQSSIWQWCPATGWLTARLRVRCPRLAAAQAQGLTGRAGAPGAEPYTAAEFSPPLPLPSRSQPARTLPMRSLPPLSSPLTRVSSAKH